MAGTFGYEAEHYELSMNIGELKLFPRIRTLTTLKDPSLKSKPKETNPERHQDGFGRAWEGVVSSGAACRMQIKQGTGVDAVHPIVLVAKRIQEWKDYAKQ